MSGHTKIKLFYKLAPTLLLAACGQSEPIPHESLAWVNNYYIEHPLSSMGSTMGGWLFRGAKDFQGELRVGFLVPGSFNIDPDKRKAILNRICPLKFEKIWQILPSENKLVIHVWSKDNKFKDSVVC